MTDDQLKAEVVGLQDAFGAVSMARNSGGQTLLRIEEVTLPRGCSPKVTPALVVLTANQPRPQVYVKRGIRVPSGLEPRSTAVVAVEGEEWMQFSYSFPWDENSHSLVQFVATAIRRFSESS